MALDARFLNMRSEEEAATPGGRGGTGGGGGVFHCLWDSHRPSQRLQVPRVSYLGGQRQLDEGSLQPAKGTAEVGEYDTGLEQGGGG